MDAADQVAVPILFGLVRRPTNGKKMHPRSLSLHLRDLPVTKGLSEGRKPLKKVSNLAHCRKSEWRARRMQLSWEAPGKIEGRSRANQARRDRPGRVENRAQLLLLERHARSRFLRLLYESEAPGAEGNRRV